MGKANRLSQRVDWQEGVENNNKNRTLIKQEWVREAETLVEDGNLRERIKKAQEGDEKVVKVVEELKKARMKNLRDEKQAIKERIVIREGYIYIPEGDLRREIIHFYHNTPVGGYGGRWKMAGLATRNYWWPGVTREVGRYVDRYNIY